MPVNREIQIPVKRVGRVRMTWQYAVLLAVAFVITTPGWQWRRWACQAIGYAALAVGTAWLIWQIAGLQP